MKPSSNTIVVPRGTEILYQKYVQKGVQVIKSTIDRKVSVGEIFLIGEKHQRIDISFPGGKKFHFNGIAWYPTHLPKVLRMV